MKLTGISDRGLWVIGLLVTLLWVVIFAERAVVRRMERDHYEFLRTLPASAPVDTTPKYPQRAKPRPTRQPEAVQS